MSTPLILVSVGSDHHPFDRLVAYADQWAAAHPDHRVVVQYGTSTPPATAEGEAYLDYVVLQDLMGQADAIATQGGPTGIVEARRHGILPLVVPRSSGLGEHVDDHQQAFARFLSESGRVRLATTEQTFADALELALQDRPENTVDPAADLAEVEATVAHFGELVADLRPRRRRARSTR